MAEIGGLLRDQTHSITHPFSVFQRNKAKGSGSFKTSGSSTRTPTLTNTPWRRSPNASATSGEMILPHWTSLPDSADATGLRFTETDSLYHSGQGPVPLDHLTHGAIRLSRQFPTARHSKCIGIHRPSSGAHWHPWKTFISPGSGFGKTTQESSQNKSGEMRIWKQGILIPGIYSYNGRDLTWLKAIKDAKLPTDIKTIRSFAGLCNFFRTHIKDFTVIAAPLFKLTRKDSKYKFGPLTEQAQVFLRSS